MILEKAILVTPIMCTMLRTDWRKSEFILIYSCLFSV